MRHRRSYLPLILMIVAGLAVGGILFSGYYFANMKPVEKQVVVPVQAGN